MKLNKIIIGGFLIVALIPFFFIGYLSINSQVISQISTTLTAESQQVVLIKDSIETFLKNSESDVLFLSELQNLKKLINAQDNSQFEQAKFNLQQDFLAFSNEKKIYYQLRYLDETGMEIVRVDLIGEKAKIIPDAELQNKKGRYYFEDAMSAYNGIVFVSPLDLNIERGKLENRGTIEDPIYVPVIRYATPVFNDLNEPKGIVITNIYADQFLRIVQTIQEPGKISILANKEGFYLSHPNKSKEFGFMFENNQTLSNDYGEWIAHETIIHPKEETEAMSIYSTSIHQDVSIEDYENHFLMSAHIWPSGNQILSSTGSNKAYSRSIAKVQGNDYYWTFITLAEKEYLLASITKLRNRAISWGIAIAIIITLSSFFLARNITRPIENLMNSARIIGKGNLNVPIKIKPKNEIGELAKTLEEMRINLKYSRTQLVEKKKLELAHKKLNKAYEDLTKSNKLKDLFIDIMRHDLLNPAGVIRANSQLAIGEEKSKEKKELLNKIYRVSDRIIKMVESASTFAKLESEEKIEFKEEDLGTILTNSIEELASKAKERNIKIIANIKEKHLAKVNHLIHDVFSNLISNAIKYSPENSEIIIDIKKQNSGYQISVTDKGEGISNQHKKAIFERFTRLKKGAIKGSGLGLAIVKKVVEVHKGKVWVEDNPRGGSTFIVEIPKQKI